MASRKIVLTVSCLCLIFLQITTASSANKKKQSPKMILKKYHIYNDCEPRETLVKVSNLLFGYHKDSTPMYVTLKQCQGGSFHSPLTACQPTEFSNTTILVGFPKPNSDDIEKCYEYTIKEHKACDILCKTKSEHCRKEQYYDENNCSCECKNDMECDEPMIFDSKTCSCVCPNEEECTHGAIWIAKRCMCMLAYISEAGKKMLKPM